MRLPLPQGALKKRKKARYLGTMAPLFLRLFEIFRCPKKVFYGVFKLLRQRNGQKRDKKKGVDFFGFTPTAVSNGHKPTPPVVREMGLQINGAGRWPFGVGVTNPARPPDPTNMATNRQPAMYPIPAGSIDF
jgi:hypothetical protein